MQQRSRFDVSYHDCSILSNESYQPITVQCGGAKQLPPYEVVRIGDLSIFIYEDRLRELRDKITAHLYVLAEGRCMPIPPAPTQEARSLQ